MFALLGDITLDLHTAPDVLDGTYATDFAELARIAGKPGLQRIADGLDEYNLSFTLHHQSCDPASVWKKMNEARISGKAQALVLGTDYRGYYVITAATASLTLASAAGKIQALAVTLTLREYTGDPADPLKPPTLPGVKGSNTGIKAKLPGKSGSKGGIFGSIGEMARTATKYAREAQTAFRQAQHVVQVAQSFKNDPLGAMTRLPGMMSSLGGVTGSLGKAIPALSGLNGLVKDAAPALKSLSNVAGKVKQAQGSLETLKRGIASGDPLSVLSSLSGAAGSIGGIADSLPGLTDTLPAAVTDTAASMSRAVSGTFDRVSSLVHSAARDVEQAGSAIGRLAARTITRQV